MVSGYKNAQVVKPSSYVISLASVRSVTLAYVRTVKRNGVRWATRTAPNVGSLSQLVSDEKISTPRQRNIFTYTVIITYFVIRFPLKPTAHIGTLIA